LAADSVRPDHLSALGYGRPTTPRLDGLIARGTLFSRATAPLAGTTPSWISILTGLYPHHHGVRHMFPDRRSRPAALPTIVKEAQRRGYRTSIASDYAGDFFSSFQLGFDQQAVPPPFDLSTVYQREWARASPIALALLQPLPDRVRPSIFRHLLESTEPERLAAEVVADLSDPRPFFAAVFFSTPHVPFAAPWPYATRFADPRYRGPDRFAYDLSAIADVARAENPLDPGDVQQVVSLYDGALASVDAAIGTILDALTAAGRDRDTLVVFLADHGENLFEPGQTTLHGRWFRGGDQANRVPLIFAGPGVTAGRAVEEPVSLVDVAPTLGEQLGWPMDEPDGRSLSAALAGEPLEERPVFAETGLWLFGDGGEGGVRYPPLAESLTVDPADGDRIVLRPELEDVVVRAKHRAIWSGRWKMIYQPLSDGARVQLYDLAADPAQKTDLGRAHPQFEPLRRQLLEWLKEDPEREMDPRGHLVRRAG
jgi:arylsulfatase A-like enzyme